MSAGPGAGALPRLLASMGAADRRPGAGHARDGGASALRSRRPFLPTPAFLAAGIWMATAFGIDLLFEGGQAALSACVLAAATALALAAAAAARGHAAPACLLLGAGLGLLLALGQCFALESQRAQLAASGGVQEIEVVRDARDTGFGKSFLGRTDGGALVRVSYRGTERLLVGQTAAFRPHWREPGDKQARDCWRNGIAAIANAEGIEAGPPSGLLGPIRAARARALSLIDDSARSMGESMGRDCSQAALFLKAVLLGYVDGLYDSPLYQAVKACGLAHLVAVSGTHLVIVCGAIAVAMRRLPIARPAGIALQVLVIGSYLALTGAPVSAVRAACMSVLALVSFFAGRRPHSLGALSACVSLMVALEPPAAFSGSLRYSALATLGIVLYAGLVGDWLRAIGRPLGGTLGDALALTIAAGILTAAPSASQFNQVSLISPVANVVAAALFGPLCVCGMAALVLCALAPPAGALALSAIIAGCLPFCQLLQTMSAIPLASVPCALGAAQATFVTFAFGAAAWVLWPRPSRAALAVAAGAFPAILVAMAILPCLHGDEIVMLDVGQGDAILVRSGGHALLVDTGNQDDRLLGGLGAQGIWRLDAVLITHPDDDHCGSLPALRGTVGVGAVLVANGLAEDPNPHCAGLREKAREVAGEDGLVELHAGDTVACGRIRLEIVGPERLSEGGGNADSVTAVLRADPDGDGHVDHVALLCGDAEAAQLRAYCEKGLIPDVDIYKVGHHGSRAAIDPALAARLSPEISLVSVGEGNRYGHPAPETIAALEDAGSAVVRTDRRGTVTCRLESGRIEVATQYG